MPSVHYQSTEPRANTDMFSESTEHFIQDFHFYAGNNHDNKWIQRTVVNLHVNVKKQTKLCVE